MFSCSHLRDRQFDEKFNIEVEIDVEHMKNDEVQAVLQMRREGISPGPDKMYSEPMLYAGKYLQQSIHLIYSKSWKECTIPEDWKQVEVECLRKSGKASYHSASAYRPISLTSCLGEGLERIMTQRLYAFCEHNNILDKDQECVRRFRSCNHAVIHLVKNVQWL